MNNNIFSSNYKLNGSSNFFSNNEKDDKSNDSNRDSSDFNIEEMVENFGEKIRELVIQYRGTIIDDDKRDILDEQDQLRIKLNGIINNKGNSRFSETCDNLIKTSLIGLESSFKIEKEAQKKQIT